MSKAVSKVFTGVDAKLVEAIVDVMGGDEKDITGSASFVDDLGCDSLDVVEIMMAVEEAYDIEIPDDEATFATVQEFSDYIRKKKGPSK